MERNDVCIAQSKDLRNACKSWMLVLSYHRFGRMIILRLCEIYKDKILKLYENVRLRLLFPHFYEWIFQTYFKFSLKRCRFSVLLHATRKYLSLMKLFETIKLFYYP